MWDRSGLLNGEETTDEWMIDAFRRHDEEVRATVPADRLLVWSPKDGWEPLCAHLELPVPEMPLPHINDTQAYGERIIDGGLARGPGAPAGPDRRGRARQLTSHSPVAPR